MLYFIHHPAGPVVIRTSNPYIVLSYQHNGWLTTTSWPEVLEDHPEWQARSSECTCADEQPPSLVGRVLSGLGAMLAIVPTYVPTRVQGTATLLTSRARPADDVEDEEWEMVDEEPISNTGPVNFLTAIPRIRYHERGLSTPTEGWTMCTEGDEVFDYRLEQGVWELDLVPEYAEEA